MKRNAVNCLYCGAPPSERRTIANFKHYWHRCVVCGNMHRENKAQYPADRLIGFLSASRLGRKIANRLFPAFMRRSDSEAQAYASYGEAYHWVFRTERIDNRFVAMKRDRYLSEHNEVIDLFKSNGISLGDKSVLDVSGGPGSFAHLIAPYVKEIAVSEYDATTVAAMQEILGDEARVFQADLNDTWRDRQNFDVALYRSCVYFCHDFDAHLAQFKHHVTDGGYVYIQSNLPTLGNCLRWQYEDYTHNVFYHPKSIQTMLMRNGFSVVSSGINPSYSHYLEWFTVGESIPLLWGLWNIALPWAPRGLNARSSWVLARKDK
jgi:SAM-dependent methyltransferase